MRLSQLFFRYGRRAPWVLTDVCLTLASGDVVEVSGANGAGKSTLLRLLAGLTPPTRGAIEGRPAVVGFAPDHFPVGQPFTVADYLRHMARIRGGARYEPWAERLGLSPMLGHRLRDLSKGSAHKVGLVQALMAAPGLLILDEPFAGLDAVTRDTLPEIVTEIAARGGIVIASDHQNGLSALPSVRHWSVADGHLTERATPTPSPTVPAPLSSPAAASQAAPSTAVVEVTLPADEAPALIARLRDQGYDVRERTLA
ncbi:ATP-binding cassette domain-containing protein [Nonomuraea sp. NPDC046570]|uniref:ABC transporter ATP-binding protein n=1 Tax=Nonomuraea sp. NPDC046570 TaxID=3155255 RepID=UPI00340C21E1